LLRKLRSARTVLTLSPLKQFLLAALLWLPLAFFLWFWFAGP